MSVSTEFRTTCNHSGMPPLAQCRRVNTDCFMKYGVWVILVRIRIFQTPIFKGNRIFCEWIPALVWSSKLRKTFSEKQRSRQWWGDLSYRYGHLTTLWQVPIHSHLFHCPARPLRCCTLPPERHLGVRPSTRKPAAMSRDWVSTSGYVGRRDVLLVPFGSPSRWHCHEFRKGGEIATWSIVKLLTNLSAKPSLVITIVIIIWICNLITTVTVHESHVHISAYNVSATRDSAKNSIISNTKSSSAFQRAIDGVRILPLSLKGWLKYWIFSFSG